MNLSDALRSAMEGCQNDEDRAEAVLKVLDLSERDACIVEKDDLSHLMAYIAESDGGEISQPEGWTPEEVDHLIAIYKEFMVLLGPDYLDLDDDE